MTLDFQQYFALRRFHRFPCFIQVNEAKSIRISMSAIWLRVVFGLSDNLFYSSGFSQEPANIPQLSTVIVFVKAKGSNIFNLFGIEMIKRIQFCI